MYTIIPDYYYCYCTIDLQQGVSPVEALKSLPDTHKGALEDTNGPTTVLRTRSLLTDVPSWTTDREDVSIITSEYSVYTITCY